MWLPALISLLVLALSSLSYVLGYDWFNLLPANDTLGTIISSVSFTGSIHGVFISLIVLAIHSATTARQCWRHLLCILPVLSVAILLAWGLKNLIAEPRPNVAMLQQAGLLSQDYYQQDHDDKISTMEAALSQALTVPEFVKRDWVMETGYAMPSIHTVIALTLGLYFFAIFRRDQRHRTAWALLCWAYIVCYSRLLLNVHRPEDLIVGAVIASLAAAMGFKILQNKEHKDQLRIKARAEKLAEAHRSTGVTRD
ncbi:phosphatase PAP2 family protein [Motilimonas pumila]|uniref:undecaprenyl-diphosphate phosphatase n=1 Tax=Motilimonas pumila TaxID=2303987 RepID=A0A418YBP8_9GAMM|nr:phosphatase PAP2 family protein [Motilimonas pumila]RJG41940.1 phosphatase PAP2 family protein [Motilimonas pumila]